MKWTFIILSIAMLTGISGCGNFSPRNQPRIDNQGGKIDEIRNNQNGVMAEIGKLKQDAEIQNSQLKEVQNGLLNLNASLSRNENSGVQILQGDGALMLVFSLSVIAMLLYWYRDRAIVSEKSANLMAKEIARFNHPTLNDNILKAAMYSNAESHVYNLLTKSRKDLKK
jgi:hypothetical protein